MAKPSTTHVIEIEVGLGEPAFLPLTFGLELAPISVGRTGTWRIEAARVLDLHAFFYFDGTFLYIQSAHESSPVTVDGHPVGTEWAQLYAPCHIDIGAARLRFRSLDSVATEETATRSRERPAIRIAPPGTSVLPPRSALPRRSAPPAIRRARSGAPSRSVPAPRPAAGAPPDPAVPTFPKAERPFRPGAFATGGSDDESTRLAPLDSSAPRSGRGLAVPPSSRPSRGRGLEDAASPYAEPVRPLPHAMPPPDFHAPPSAPMSSMRRDAPTLPAESAPAPLDAASLGGPAPTYAAPEPWRGTIPDASRSPVPEASGPSVDESSPPKKGASAPRRILVAIAPFSLIALAYLVFFDGGSKPQPHSVAAADAGATTQATAAAEATASATEPTPGPSVCPDGFVAYAVPVGGIYPCVPVGTPMPEAGAEASPVGEDPAPAAEASAASAAEPTASGRRASPNTKTLERQAVDALAVNDYARAAELYEELDRTTPNRTYAEAARILRTKLDAGAF